MRRDNPCYQQQYRVYYRYLGVKCSADDQTILICWSVHLQCSRKSWNQGVSGKCAGTANMKKEIENYKEFGVQPETMGMKSLFARNFESKRTSYMSLTPLQPKGCTAFRFLVSLQSFMHKVYPYLPYYHAQHWLSWLVTAQKSDFTRNDINSDKMFEIPNNAVQYIYTQFWHATKKDVLKRKQSHHWH